MRQNSLASWIGFGLALVVMALPVAHGQAQAPAYMPVQGMLTDDAGTPRDGDFVFELRLYGVATGVTAFYAESKTVTVDQGLFTVYLGDGTPAGLGNGTTSDVFDLALFKGRPQGIVFLGISIDGAAEMSPRVQLGSVPFAAFAAYAPSCGDADSVGGLSASALQPKISGTCASNEAVVGVSSVGVLECRASAGPQGPQGLPGPTGANGADGKDGANGRDGTTYAPGGGLSLNTSNQLSVDFSGSSGSANTAARSHHTHTWKWYGRDTSPTGTSPADMSTSLVHEVCMLAQVRFDGSSAGSVKYCYAGRNTDGTWRLRAEASAGDRTKCEFWCN